jgi:hypothetical protein
LVWLPQCCPRGVAQARRQSPFPIQVRKESFLTDSNRGDVSSSEEFARLP